MARRISPSARYRYIVPAGPAAQRRRRWLEAAILVAWSIVAIALAAGDGGLVFGR
jgi:hypothetical protein